MLAPEYNGSKKPIVHSYVWCNGKIEKNKSLLFTLTIP